MPLVRSEDGLAEPLDEAALRARKIRPELTRGPLVRVAGARNQAEAELVQGMLLEEGVPSVLRRTAGFDVPDFLAAGPRDVLVPESGVEVARTALTAAGAPEPAAGPLRPPRAWPLAAALCAGAGLAALVAWALVQLGH